MDIILNWANRSKRYTAQAPAPFAAVQSYGDSVPSMPTRINKIFAQQDILAPVGQTVIGQKKRVFSVKCITGMIRKRQTVEKRFDEIADTAPADTYPCG